MRWQLCFITKTLDRRINLGSCLCFMLHSYGAGVTNVVPSGTRSPAGLF